MKRDDQMNRKWLVIMPVIIGALAIFIVAGLLLFGQQDDQSEENSIFEEVSTLEALNLGLIDGEELRAREGITTPDGSDSQQLQTQVVSVSLRSLQNDLKIKMSDQDSGRLIYDVPFSVTVEGGGAQNTYTDDDKDGIIYITGLKAGDYVVTLSECTEGNTTYMSDGSKKITVSDAIVYEKVDVKDEIKTESEVNVAAEDTKQADEDQTTDVSASEASSEEEEVEPNFDDLTQEDEDLLAAIEAEAEAQEQNNPQEGQDQGGQQESTSSILDDPSYIAAHEGRKGIDVSKHNGNIDWNQVKDAGISFAMIRCGYRGSSSGVLVVDPMFEANMNGAINAGIDVGVYFFSQAVDEAEAVEEASMVLDLISGYNLQMPVYVDVEKSNGRGDEISKEERTAVSKAFLSTISNSGYSAGIYSNKLWFENRIDAGSFGDYRIWMAQYVDIPTYGGRYDMWQYTSKGSVPGIPGNVDMNVLK
jgi:GH25 family lysozyme M1 (1,4-beta-N-acetylmuramidase)